MNPILYRLILASLIWNAASYARAAESHQNADAVNWMDACAQVGPRLGVYFTIERNLHLGPDTYGEPLVGAKPVDLSGAGNIRILIEQLRVVIPDATVEQDLSSDKIIHIRARSLTHYDDDVLDQKFSMDFEGTPSSLIDELARRTGSRLHEGGGGSIPMLTPYVPPFNEHIKISAQNLSARELLSNFLPLGHCQTILWTADCYTLQGHHVAQVLYSPAPRDASISRPSERVP